MYRRGLSICGLGRNICTAWSTRLAALPCNHSRCFDAMSIPDHISAHTDVLFVLARILPFPTMMREYFFVL